MSLSCGRKIESDTERSEEHTSELQSRLHLVCRLLLEKKKKNEADARVNLVKVMNLCQYNKPCRKSHSLLSLTTLHVATFGIACTSYLRRPGCNLRLD